MDYSKPLSFLLLIIIGISYVESIAVLSIDLGSEWMKIGIVSPGVPMEIVLNKESKRKTPAVVSFRDNQRTFGEDAQNIGLRFPKNSYSYLMDLLAKDINHPVVQLYRKRFPYYDIIEDQERGTITFKHDDTTTYSPEELVAQLLTKAKDFAEIYAKQPINECVLTVPGYFNQAERKALLQAAELAKLKVLQLINDYTATALNYGIFRVKDFNETSTYIMLYDMGASSTTASVISFQTVKTKERGFVETHPQLTVLGVGYDRTLGGLEMQLRLRDYLGKKFNEMKKTPNDVFENARAMAKLFKEAGRLKQVLSANAEHIAQIEGLLDDKDFRVMVKREEFENLCGDLFDRVAAPVEQALKVAGLSSEILSQVILVGAGTRVPKVQEKLQKAIRKELAKNLNTDEAAALGAVYKAADLSTGFQVKKFITKDGVLFPVQIHFERENENGIKQVKRTLFGLMNPYPQKKIITFNKHTDDFSFNVNYGDLNHLSEQEISNLGALNLTEIQVEGVAAALEKAKGENLESKGIKAHFNMDESGILKLNNVELIIEKTGGEDEDIEGTISKLGSTISKFFTGDSETEQTGEETPTTTTETPKKENVTESKEQPKNETTSANQTEKEAPKETKPKVVVLKEPIDAKEIPVFKTILNQEQLDQMYEKLEKLNRIDREVQRKANALNNLESFIIETQNRLYEEEYSSAVTEEETETIKAACSEMQEWLYEDDSASDAEVYEAKYHDLRMLTKDWHARVFEHKERPEALSALNSMLNGSEHFLTSIKNLTKSTNPEKAVFTETEIETLQKVITQTKEWMEKMVEEQNKLKNSEPVVLTVKSISDKMATLDREVKYLVNKLKIWKPLRVDKPKEESNKTEEESKTNRTEESKKEESDEGAVENESSGSGDEDIHSEL